MGNSKNFNHNLVSMCLRLTFQKGSFSTLGSILSLRAMDSSALNLKMYQILKANYWGKYSHRIIAFRAASSDSLGSRDRSEVSEERAEEEAENGGEERPGEGDAESGSGSGGGGIGGGGRESSSPLWAGRKNPSEEEKSQGGSSSWWNAACSNPSSPFSPMLDDVSTGVGGGGGGGGMFTLTSLK